MIYQIRINLFIANEGIARGLYNHAKGVMPDAITINPTSPNLEYSSIELIENHHDTDPTKPCQLLETQFSPK